MNNIIPNKAFYVNTNVVYPPFKAGFYMEEYFLNYAISKKVFHDREGRRYIPALWTNFQLASWFKSYGRIMQRHLTEFINKNYCDKGYFTVVQHDDGPFLRLPENTIVYGACNGNIPLPLIYENKHNTLVKMGENNMKSFSEREILCSFVGFTTHSVRNKCVDILSKVPGFDIYIPEKVWTLTVEKPNQDIFINKTLNSKFALAPRGYGRSSFRFFEIFLLGCIPIYVWDDIEWLPYKDILDYTMFCISINVNEIDKLPDILNGIDETKYNEMKMEYGKIKHMFELDFMCKYITEKCEKP